MFLIIPYDPPAGFKQLPYLSYLLLLICVVVFYFQHQNVKTMSTDIDSFCQQLSKISVNENINLLDKMRSDELLCSLMIKRLEQRPDLTIVEVIHQYFWFEDHSRQQIETMAGYIQQHYKRYAKNNTRYLNKQLMYYPDTLDVSKMFSASFAHADGWHLAGNIIFMLAFAPAVEIFLARAWLFLLLVSVSIVTTMISYSVSVFLGGDSLPALGLSGVVMAMMGLYAALMPKKKIRLFVWLLTYIRNWYVPAWVLVAWYIGLDFIDLILGTGNASINLIAHVSGGVTGFLIGYFIIKKYYQPKN